MGSGCGDGALRHSPLVENLPVARRWGGRGCPSQTVWSLHPAAPWKAPSSESSESIPAVLTAGSQTLKQQDLGQGFFWGGGEKYLNRGAVSEQADAPPL